MSGLEKLNIGKNFSSVQEDKLKRLSNLPEIVKLNCRGQEIETELRFEPEWMPLPERRACRIIAYQDMPDLSEKSSWPALQSWMISTLEQMHSVFGWRVKNLVRDLGP